MGDFAKFMILAGLVLVAAGLVLLALQRFPFLGKLPGDIVIKRENFSFYFPLASSIIISIVVSIILYLIGRSK